MDCFAALAMTVSNQRRSRLLLPSPWRFSGRLGNLLTLFPPAQDLHREHRMIEALQVQLFERVAFDPALDHAEHAPANHDLVGLGFVAQPRGEVGDAADRGVFEPLLETDLAQRRIAERDADAEAEAV